MTRELLSLLENDITRTTFEAVAKERTVRLKDLRESLGMEKEEALEALGQLEAANLIKAQGVPEDFRWYYVTEEGLAAERELHRLELTT